MTVEQLMHPRYKVIDTYPNSIYKVGAIIEGDGKHFFNIAFFETYPHLFRKLEWWEERKPEDMPKYLKSNLEDKAWNNNIVFEKVEQYYGECNEYVSLVDRQEDLQYCTSWYLPVTEQEYLSFIKTTQP